MAYAYQLSGASYDVFSLVHQAVVMRCSDLLLLFLFFHCRRRPGPPLALLFHFSYTAAAVSSSSSSILYSSSSSSILFLFIQCRRRPGPPLALLFHFSYTAAAAAVSSSSLFVTQHSFPIQPDVICPLFLSPQLHLPFNENVNLVVGSMTRDNHLIVSPPNPPEMSYTTQLSDIKQSRVQIPPPN